MSGDKSGKAFQVDMRTSEITQICEVKAQILDIAVRENEVWVATTDSDLNSYQRMSVNRGVVGKPSLISYELTDNKKFVVTKNTENLVQVRNVLDGIIQDFDGTIEEAVKRTNTGKNSNSWFTVNLRLGCLMLDFTQNDVFAAGEIINETPFIYGEFLIRKLFFYLIQREEAKIHEKEGVTQKQLIKPESCDFDSATIIINHPTGEGVLQPIVFTEVQKILSCTSLQIPLWLQKIVIKAKSK